MSYFDRLLDGEDITEVINTGRGDFTVKYTTGRGDIEIINRAKVFSSSPDLTDGEKHLMIQYASLDVVVVNGPDWYEDWKRRRSKKNESVSWIDIPDVSLVLELYRGYLQWSVQVYKEIQVTSGESSGGDEVGKRADVQENMGNPTIRGSTDKL